MESIMIYQVDIQENRTHYIAHLEDEEQLFFVVPKSDDGSDDWKRLQQWLDDGNEIGDTIEWKQMYSAKRNKQYPELAEQFDMLWHAMDTDSLDKTSDFYLKLKAVKDANPKPD